MTQGYVEQVKFTRGEIDPLLIQRSDVEPYYGGVSKLENLLVMKQGGVKSRDGLRYVNELPIGKHKLITFEVSSYDRYLIIISEGKIEIYFKDQLLVTLNQSVYTGDEIRYTNYCVYNDAIILLNPFIKPMLLKREAHTNWTFSEINFTNVPKYRFSNQPDRSLSGNIKTDSVTGSGKLTATVDVFKASDVNQYVVGNGGRGRVVEFRNAKTVIIKIETEFYDEESVGGWVVESGYENAWSDTRGYPGCGTFYKGRLILSGSLILPQLVWFSKTNFFFDFDLGTGLDTDAVEFPLDGYSPVVNIQSGRSLFVFTTSDEYILSNTFDEAITPSNVSFKLQTSIGSQRWLPVYDIEGAIFFCNSSSLHQFLYDYNQQAYSSSIVSIMSGHLIKDPVDLAMRKEYVNIDSTYLVIINEDGSATFVSVLASQDIMGFSNITTEDGIFINSGTDNDSIYVIVEREINGLKRHYLEVFDPTCVLDSSVKLVNQGTTITGLEHLEGQTVEVFADGNVMKQKVVESGSIEVERPSKEIEIGFNFNVLLEDLPPTNLAFGGKAPSTMGRKKRIAQLVISLSDTNSCAINGKRISFKTFGPRGHGSPLNSNQPFFTGTKIINGILGWSNDAKVSITKPYPGKMTILGFNKKVNVSL